MKLKEFFVQQRWAIGFAEVRRYILNGKVKVNDVVLTSDNSADLVLHAGDIVQFGKHPAVKVDCFL